MRSHQSLTQAISEEVQLVAHYAQWAEQFSEERNRLLDLLPGHFTAIEHIGSTAVPGLAAKPIIDLLAGVSSMNAADSSLEPLCANGYETSAEFNASLPDRRWLMRHALGRRTHHLHLVIFDGEHWIGWLRFRDALRADDDLATRYGHLKQALAEIYRHDREHYTLAKKAFIDEVLASLA